ncbi:MAG: putative transketolase N-terminal section [Promethearchaeota archaeon]|nr:MAG: putative transketolase N-terminal section [Candidatus Lokiarchaeota archaeon]
MVVLSASEEKELLIDILEIKKDILTMIYKAQSGHPGGSLSCANLIYLLYKKVMKIDSQNPAWKERDYFILSKGHAAPALYAVLSKIGFIDRSELFTLRQLGSTLQGHPIKNEQLGIEVSTGSLGMGLSIGVGCALAAKLDKNNRRIYVVLGDGELNEGSTWEAAMAASHYKLDNLTAIIDRNGIQIDGSTEEVMALEPLAEKWKAFGWNVIEVDGSNLGELFEGFNKSKNIIRKPTVLISYLIKGSDVSFMEHTKKYHGRPPSKQEYTSAISEIDQIIETISVK